MGGLTQELPKPMLLVQGKPILEHIVSGLVASGIRQICVITGWRAEVIEGHFGNGHALDAQIQYARQIVQDGTGKAPELAKDFVGADDFLLTYGDILVRPETYAQMITRFHSGNFAGLLTVTEGEDVTKGGLNFFDEEFCLQQLIEKPSPSQIEELRAAGRLKAGQPVWYNAGIYLFRPEVFDYTARLQKSPRGEYELTDAVSAMVNAGRRIVGLPIQGRWVDVRDPQVLEQLQQGGM